MAIKIGHGSELQRGDGGSPEVFTKIANVDTINGPGLSRETEDVTDMDSTAGWREFIYGLKDGGEISLDLNYDPADSTIAASAGLLSAFAATAEENYKIVFADAASTTWSFAALLTNFEPSTPVGGKMTASATLKISGQPTIA